MKRLFVDDKRQPPFEAVFAAGNMRALSFLEETVQLPEAERRIDEIWLDYNLPFGGTTEETANWLAQNAVSDSPISVGTIFFHSNDPQGRRALHDILDPHFNCVDTELHNVELI